MSKIADPQTVSEWVSELHRVAALGVETGTRHFSDHKQALNTDRALDNVQRRFGEWIKTHPEVEVPEFIKGQSWAH